MAYRTGQYHRHAFMLKLDQPTTFFPLEPGGILKIDLLPGGTLSRDLSSSAP